MDLQVYAIILIVFLVSFASYLFISKFLPHGKTFDEMIAEKKRMREEVLGTLKTSNTKQSILSNKKKPRKELKKRDTQSKIIKEVTSNESDVSESSEAHSQDVLTTMRVSPEISRKNVSKQQATAQQTTRKTKGKTGILVNKNEPVLIKDAETSEEINHFEEIHPKDAVEIQRSSEEKNAKNFRKNKPAKETPPISPKNQPDVKAVVEEKNVKKKKTDQLSAVDGKTVQLVTDETGITPLIRELSRADLTKNQIQVLIDFLLNKQSDTITKDPTEWSEGKADVLQKLKKQLQEKEAQLKNEQDALSGMQIKLKELRTELNGEKIQFNASLKSYIEQIQNYKSETKTLQSEIQFLNEKHNNEKQTMTTSLKQLQAKYLQVQESLKAQESSVNIQQVQNENQLLQQEIVNKNKHIIELNALVDEKCQKEETFNLKLNEYESKLVEYENCMRKKDENLKVIENDLRQRVQDNATRESESKKLNAEISHIQEIFQRQIVEIDQLKHQLNDQRQINIHTDESNKIEIRNLQNELDSRNKELDVNKALVNDYKKKLDDLNKQIVDSKQLANKSGDNFLMNEKLSEIMANHQSVMCEKDRQIIEYQKQIEKLQKIESDLSMQIEEQKVKNNTQQTVDVSKVKDLISKYFPNTIVSSNDDTNWLENALENLKLQLASSNKTNLNCNTSSSSNAKLLNNCSDLEKNKLNSSTVNLNGDTNSTSSKADNEMILLQNAQLKTTLEEYKNIISETESMLKNLESKVREQDAYWTKVVLMKDNEIENLKFCVEKS
ncbi:putative leucine-rich repeat-containing protein DDB_G0290503 isoform X2 [Chironomus tepperi]|uniref:putative leucine-rich repeat-containing protein DDB_G0290503 isoform X2 n=1 Tax=Chironomus tepperi TaxID=113505 RepID=UPI00391F0C2E